MIEPCPFCGMEPYEVAKGFCEHPHSKFERVCFLEGYIFLIEWWNKRYDKK